MSKKRVYELARELGIDSKELIAHLEKIGVSVKSYASVLENSDVERIKRTLRAAEPHELVEERIKATVIRRRAVHIPVVEPETFVVEKKETVKARHDKAAATQAVPVSQEAAEKEISAPQIPIPAKKPSAGKVDTVAGAVVSKPLPPEVKKTITEKKSVPGTP